MHQKEKKLDKKIKNLWKGKGSGVYKILLSNNFSTFLLGFKSSSLPTESESSELSSRFFFFLFNLSGLQQKFPQ